MTHFRRPITLLAAILIAVSGLGMAADLVLPDADSVRAVDRPSDDGTAFFLEWPKTDKNSGGVQYIIDVAKDPADFGAKDEEGKDKAKRLTIQPKGSLKSDSPRYYGFGEANKKWHSAEIEPARLFAPKEEDSPTYHERRVLKAMDEWTATAIKHIEAPGKALKAIEMAVPAHAKFRSKLLGLDGRASEADIEWAEGLIATFRDHKIPPLQKALAAIPADTEDALQITRREWLADGIAILDAPGQAGEASTKALDEYPDLSRVVADEDHELKEGEAERVARLTKLFADRDVPGLRRHLLWVTRRLAYLTKRERERERDEKLQIAGGTYHCRLGVVRGGETVYVSQDGAPATFSVTARPNVFKKFKLNNLIFALLFSGIVLAFIQVARRNPNLFIRKINGLEAVEEAIGRATEMGRPVFFVHGLGQVSGLATIASVNVLSRVARRAADYGTRVRVTNMDPIVTAVSQEVVQQAYTEAGRPDAYSADDVSLMARDQFSYSAAVTGLMMREKPAAIFLMGTFAAESLLLAETGSSTGAIQIAGTESYAQLPFFVTTCDYTLIGEELFAASAYLSREPKMLGSLRGQDIAKAFMMIALAVITALLSLHAEFGWALNWLKTLFETP
ncbi:hypothetical protein HQ560_21090 [bacterium]|nr:hypothetical protein [bacterium]